MVQEICKDILDLDFAKGNLTTTISTLQKLHIIATEPDNMKKLVLDRQFQEAALLLEGVKQTLSEFSNYDVERVKEMLASFARTETELKKTAFQLFG